MSARVDVHHHVLPPRFVDSTPMPVSVPDPETQLCTMEGFGIEVAITSLTPRVLSGDRARRVAVARACNEFQAQLIRDHPARFGGLTMLPAPHVDACLEELAYALDTLRLDGVEMFSSTDGIYLGDAHYEPLLEELNRRGCVVFVHPTHCAAPPELNLGAPAGILEYVVDTSRAILNMLHTGWVRRFPNVRWLFSHAGGTIPFLSHRISGLGPDALPDLKRLNYDVASAMGPHALRSLQELVPVDQILWGSDLPLVHGQRLQHEIDEWEAYDGLVGEARQAVERQNALRLFPEVGARASAGVAR
jgi:aminocarboxymuconate-semialdehyde decarboxylase